MDNRRDFIKRSAASSAGIVIGARAFSTRRYANIIGANDRIHVAVIGVNGRGRIMAGTIVKQS
jgi:hypothetical protein